MCLIGQDRKLSFVSHTCVHSVLSVFSEKPRWHSPIAHRSAYQDGLCHLAHTKILRIVYFTRWPMPSCCMLRCTIVACQTGFPSIKNYGNVSTLFECFDAGHCRSWKDARPRPRSIFYQEETIGTYGTMTIDRNYLNYVGDN